MLAALHFVLSASGAQAASGHGPDDPIRALLGRGIRVTDKERGDRVSPRSFAGTLVDYDGKHLLVANAKEAVMG